MNLSFSENFPKRMGGKRTYFVWKILESLTDSGWLPEENNYYDTVVAKEPMYPLFKEPKLHTIRKGNRWKQGDKIHFCIGLRTKNYFQFAPVMEVKGVQDISIFHDEKRVVKVRVDGFLLIGNALEDLALNDGFDSVEQFFEYFNEDFEGQIIHWTDLKY